MEVTFTLDLSDNRAKKVLKLLHSLYGKNSGKDSASDEAVNGSAKEQPSSSSAPPLSVQYSLFDSTEDQSMVSAQEVKKQRSSKKFKKQALIPLDELSAIETKNKFLKKDGTIDTRKRASIAAKARWANFKAAKEGRSVDKKSNPKAGSTVKKNKKFMASDSEEHSYEGFEQIQAEDDLFKIPDRPRWGDDDYQKPEGTLISINGEDISLPLGGHAIEEEDQLTEDILQAKESFYENKRNR